MLHVCVPPCLPADELLAEVRDERTEQVRTTAHAPPVKADLSLLGGRVGSGWGRSATL